MVPAAGQNLSPEWREFLRLGEEIVKQPTAADQCRLIVETVQNLTSSQADVWLAQPFYPLPGEPEVKILPSPAAPDLIQKTYRDRQPCCQSRQGVQSASCCLDESPRQIAVPMITQGNMLGIIQADRPQGFNEPDLEYLEGLAAHAAMALQISRQVAIKNWRYGQLALVRSVSAQIANVLDLDELCQRVTTLIQQTFNYYYVAIFTLNGKEGKLPHFRACAHLAGESTDPGTFEVQAGEGIVGYVAENGTELLAGDVRNEPRYRYIDSLPETHSEFTLPLKVENHVLGVLDIQSDQPDAFHEIDMLVLRALADSIALAVEGTRLYSTLQYRADQLSAVFEVSHALNSILDPDQLLEEVVQVIHRRFDYPYVHLFTVHPGRRMIFFRAGSGERSQVYREQNVVYDLDDDTGIIPWVARTGQTLLANDVSQEPHYRPTDLPPYGTNSELTIPLHYGDEVMAVLDIQTDTPGAFDENDRSLLEALAASIAIAMRNATLYGAEKWRRRVADSFRDVAGLLSGNIALEELLDKILVALESNLPCDASALWLVEENGKDQQRLRLAASHGVSEKQIIRARQRSASVREWLDESLKTIVPTIRRPVDPYGPLGAALDFPAEYSSIAAPLLAGDRPLGVLTLAHHTSGRYGSEARDMVATFASYAVVAIQNAALYHESQEQAWISTVLLQVSEANQAVTTVEELLGSTTRLIPLLVGVKKVAVFLWEDTRQGFIFSDSYGLDGAETGSIFYEKDIPALATLMATRSTFFIHNPAEELKLPSLDVLPESGTLVILPLLSRGELRGALLVAHQVNEQPGASQPFTDQTLAILQGIAHQTAVALENIRLVEARQEEAYVTAVLLQVAQAVVSLNNLSDILDTIVHLMPILVGIDACIIYLWDKVHQTFIPTQAFSGLHQEERELLSRSYGEGEFVLLDNVRKFDTFILCPLGSDGSPADWPLAPCLPTGEMPTPGLASLGGWLAGVPLSVKGEVYGVMLAKENNVPVSTRERRMEIINGIAQEVALAIQNEHLQQEMVVRERMEREIQLAREIQRTFLPDHLPQPTGWEIDARWQTARQVGGDFYDIFRLGENRMGIVIADVADKGMPAALYMTVTRTLIRASVHHIHSPARVLERVNNLLIPDAQNGMFVTAVYAVLALDTGELTYANAGHNRPLLLRSASGAVEVLPKGGMALGVEESTPLHDEKLQLDLGDCLILYTDGVTDTFAPDGTTFGEQRLTDVLSGTDGQTAGEELNAIDHALADYRADEPMGDDVTLLAVRRKAAG